MWTLTRSTGEIHHQPAEYGLPGHAGYRPTGERRLHAQCKLHPKLLPAGTWAFHFVPNAWGTGNNVLALYDCTMKHHGKKFIISARRRKGFEEGSLVIGSKALVDEMARVAAMKPTRFSTGDKILKVIE